MRRNKVWLIVSCLVALALVSAVQGKETVLNSLGKTVERPQYGGTFTYAITAGIYNFDPPAMPSFAYAPTAEFTNEELVTGDWLKGPAGSGESGWLAEEFPRVELATGVLAERWEVVNPDTIIWHLRRGVRFHNKPPVNGREFTADDYIFSRKRCLFLETSWHYMTYTDEQRKSWSAKALDKYTVEEHFGPNQIGEALRIGGDYNFIQPREVIEQFGDQKDWKNACGTGPFMLTDYVPQNSATLKRNPDHWRKHPLYPQDTMPYLDEIRIVIIADISTQIASMRTGKIDFVRVTAPKNAQELRKTNPELKYLRHVPTMSSNIFMRMDKPELPFKDIRVRRALAMAIDRQAIADQFYDGDAEMLTFPITPYPEFRDVYIPLDQLPEKTRELWKYDPEKAKRLLAEAGYPKGFKTEIVCAASPDHVDRLEIVKAYWSAIGVDLSITPKEWGVYGSIFRNRTHNQMIMNVGVNSTPRSMNNYRPENFCNTMMVNDPYLKEVYDKTQEYFFDWDKLAKLWKEAHLYILEQAWSIEPSTPYTYTFWQPWVKGYQGEYSTGCWNLHMYWNYIWIDQSAKKKS